MSPEDEQWVESLKVHELKEELKKKGQPLAGLKAQLVQRLKETLQAEAGKGNQGTEEEQAQHGAQELEQQQVQDPAADKEEQPAQSSQHEQEKQPSPKPPASADQAAKEQHPTKERLPDEKTNVEEKFGKTCDEASSLQQQSSTNRDRAPSQQEPPAPEQQPQQDVVASILEVEQEQEALDYDQEEDPPATAMPEPEPQPESTLPKQDTEEKERSPQQEQQQQQQEQPTSSRQQLAATPSNARAKRGHATPAAEANVQATPTEAPQDQLQDGTDSGGTKRRRAPIPLYQPRDKQPAKDAGGSAQKEQPAQEPEARPQPASSGKQEHQSAGKQQQSADKAGQAEGRGRAVGGGKAAGSALRALGKAKGMEAKVDPPPFVELEEGAPLLDTPALRIDNLVRPFTEGQLRELIQQTATIMGMWMPGLKTHAIVLLGDAKQATVTQRALQGLKWPAGTHKLLSVSALPEDVAKLSIQEKKDPGASLATPTAAQGRAAVQAASAGAGVSGRKRKAATEVEVDEEGVPEPERRRMEAAKRQLEAAIKEEERQQAAAAEKKVEAKASMAQAVGAAEALKAPAATAGGEEAQEQPDKGKEGVQKGEEQKAAGKDAKDGGKSKQGLGIVAAAKAAMAAAAAEASAARQKRLKLEEEAAAKAEGAGKADDMAVDAAPTLDTLFRKTAAKPAIYWLPLTEEEVARKKRRERDYGQREPHPGMGMDPHDLRDYGDAWRSSGLEPLGYAGSTSMPLPPPPRLPPPPSRRGEDERQGLSGSYDRRRR